MLWAADQNSAVFVVVARLKLGVVDGQGQHLDRLSPWAPYVTCGTNYIYEQRFWNPSPQEVCYLCRFPAFMLTGHSTKHDILEYVFFMRP